DVDRGVQRWRRRARVEADARHLRRRTVTREQLLLRPRVDTGDRQDLFDPARDAPGPEQHEDCVSDPGIHQKFIGNEPGYEDIGGIEDFGDRSPRRQRLADIRETRRNYSVHRRKDFAVAEMEFHLIETTSKLLDKFIQGGKLNFGLADLRLLRDNGFASRGVLPQDLHAE